MCTWETWDSFLLSASTRWGHCAALFMQCSLVMKVLIFPFYTWFIPEEALFNRITVPKGPVSLFAGIFYFVFVTADLPNLTGKRRARLWASSLDCKTHFILQSGKGERFRWPQVTNVANKSKAHQDVCKEQIKKALLCTSALVFSRASDA